jgi:hypothetical protein
MTASLSGKKTDAVQERDSCRGVNTGRPSGIPDYSNAVPKIDSMDDWGCSSRPRLPNRIAIDSVKITILRKCAVVSHDGYPAVRGIFALREIISVM